MHPDNTLAEVREALKRGCYLASEIGDNLAFHQIEQALAKLDALIEGQGWQPIETAPKVDELISEVRNCPAIKDQMNISDQSRTAVNIALSRAIDHLTTHYGLVKKEK